MSVLLLRIAGPMQSWGDSSRFARRTTRREPTKSGIVGLMAAALGRGREAEVDDLAQLELGVRTEQRGRLVRDFQTERSADGRTSMPLSDRYYLTDACFLIALGGNEELLRQVDEALRVPRWPLYLGRRACPPTLPLTLGLREEYSTVREALENEKWHASEWFKRRNQPLELEIACDAHDGEPCESQVDYPLSFSAKGRRYACRPVLHYRVPNPDVQDTPKTDGSPASLEHDPLSWM